jgi:cytochrome c oxidase subunit 1
MSDTIVSLPDQSTARIPKMNYLSKENGLLSWLLTGDHKRIAILYLISITFFFFIGGALAGLIRLELLTPQSDLMATDTYNKVFTMHGVVMIFLFLVPSVPATLGNFFIPMMIGAKDLALPKVNLLSWYLYVIGGILVLVTMITGGVDTGWTFTTPLSTHYVNTNVLSTGLAVFIAGFSSIFTGLNFIVTIHKMRAPGMTWFRLPLFVWLTMRPASSWCWARRCWPSPLCCWLWSAPSASASSTPPRAAIRCCFSTCSGSTRTPPSTS